MNWSPFLFVILEILVQNCFVNCNIESTINSFYNSETVKEFENLWTMTGKSFENTLKHALWDNFGTKGINMTKRKIENVCKLSNGFYIFDNVVHVILEDMYLKELPPFKTLEVTFPAAYNVILVDAELNKMIVETKYHLMRNNSKVVFSGTNQDPFKNSPFAFQEVQHKGYLTIIAEDCHLSGFAIASKADSSYVIYLGHDTFRVSNCKFSLEISAAGLESSPVIAPYFSGEQRSLIENLLSKPIRKEIMTQLHKVLFAYMDMNLYDPNYLYCDEKKKIFKQVHDLVYEVIHSTNKWNMLKNQTSRDLRPLEIRWTEIHNEKEYEKFIQLKDIMVDGLDSAYSPKLGGPYKIQTIGITEALRYNTLRVRGKIILHLDNVTTRHEFSAELIDVSVNMELDLEDKSNTSFKTDTNVSWRNMVFSITNDKSIGKKITINERILTESLISGYLINEIPKCLPRRLNKLNENIDSRTQDMYLGNNVNPSSKVEDEPNSTVEEESDRKIEEVSNDEKKVITELIIREALPDTKNLSYSSLSFSNDDSNDDSDKD